MLLWVFVCVRERERESLAGCVRCVLSHKKASDCCIWSHNAPGRCGNMLPPIHWASLCIQDLGVLWTCMTCLT
jgi:hypothetical protein